MTVNEILLFIKCRLRLERDDFSVKVRLTTKNIKHGFILFLQIWVNDCPTLLSIAAINTMTKINSGS